MKKERIYRVRFVEKSQSAPMEALVRALSDDNSGVREQAAWALGAIGDGRALSALLVALKDDSAGVRRQAAWAIGVIGR